MTYNLLKDFILDIYYGHISTILVGERKLNVDPLRCLYLLYKKYLEFFLLYLPVMY